LVIVAYFRNWKKTTQLFTIRFIVIEITAIVKMSQEDPSIISYLRVKAFVPLDTSVQHQIDQVDTGDVVYLCKRKIYYMPELVLSLFSFPNRKKKLTYTPYSRLTQLRLNASN